SKRCASGVSRTLRFAQGNTGGQHSLYNTLRLLSIHTVYCILSAMPKLWNETVATHRQEVRDAILDAAAALVAQRGLLAVTMSQIAEEAGIGRATLYKYFSGVEEILHAWHQRQIKGHFDNLVAARDSAGSPAERLTAVLEAYALMLHETRGHLDAELSALLHKDAQVTKAEGHLKHFISHLLTNAQKAGVVRKDIAIEELAAYCQNALAAAADLPSKPAVRRLVAVVMAGLKSG
ncbi:MAG: TetR/AcrR family transcriptional regulator, partial [Anaerolineales bacterium]